MIYGWLEVAAPTKHQRNITVSLLLGLGIGVAFWGLAAFWLGGSMNLWTSIRAISVGAAGLAVLATILTRGLPWATVPASPRPKLNLTSRWTVLTAPYIGAGIVLALSTTESMLGQVYGYYPDFGKAAVVLIGTGFVLGAGWILKFAGPATVDPENLRTKRLLLAAFGALILHALAPFVDGWFYSDTFSLIVLGLSWMLLGFGVGLSVAALSRLKDLGLNLALWASIEIGGAAVYLGFNWAGYSADFSAVNAIFSSIAGALATIGFVFVLFSRGAYTQE